MIEKLVAGIMKTKAIVRLKFPSEKHQRTVYKALRPEVKKTATARSKTSLKKNDEFLILTVEAKDTIAMRAALNSYLRWVNSAINILHVLENIS